MRKIILGIGLLLLVIAAAIFIARGEVGAPSQTASQDRSSGAVSEDKPTSSGSTENAIQTDEVTIQDFSYAPQVITIKKGTTVTWVNNDSVRHDVKPTDDSTDFKGSELLSKGEKYSFTFTNAGTYTYFCTPHPSMKGTVVVTE